LGDDPVTALRARDGGGWRCFGGVAEGSCRLRVCPTHCTDLHPPIGRDKGLPAPTRNDAVLRDFLGAPGATPGIDRKARFVESPAVADDQGFSVVGHFAPKGEVHGVGPVVRLNGRLKVQFITIWPIIRNNLLSPQDPLFYSKNK